MHEGVQPFIAAGLGLWPHPEFANQMALLGPPSDPAKVRGLRDAAEALKRIAQTKSTFIVNSAAGARYVEEILFASTGDKAEGDWYVKPNVEGPAAARAAAERGGYVLWGLPPFLRLKRQGPIDLEPLLDGPGDAGQDSCVSLPGLRRAGLVACGPTQQHNGIAGLDPLRVVRARGRSVCVSWEA